MAGFWTAHKDFIAAVGVIAGVSGLFFTGWQIKLANETLEASRVYEIQRDGRALIDSFEGNPAALDYLLNYDASKTYQLKTLRSATLKIRKIIQFYSSVHNQKVAGIITDRHWPGFLKDICGFLRLQPVKQYWDQHVVAGSFSMEFKDLKKECGIS